MNKYMLMALVALSQTVAYGEKCSKEAHHEYIKTQVQLGAAAVTSACVSPLSLKLGYLSWDKAHDEEFAYQKRKELRKIQYKQNPTWKQYIKNTGWRLGWGLKNSVSVSTKLWLGAFCVASTPVTGLASIAIPTIMYQNYKDHKRQC